MPKKIFGEQNSPLQTSLEGGPIAVVHLLLAGELNFKTKIFNELKPMYLDLVCHFLGPRGGVASGAADATS